MHFSISLILGKRVGMCYYYQLSRKVIWLESLYKYSEWNHVATGRELRQRWASLRNRAAECISVTVLQMSKSNERGFGRGTEDLFIGDYSTHCAYTGSLKELPRQTNFPAFYPSPRNTVPFKCRSESHLEVPIEFPFGLV